MSQTTQNPPADVGVRSLFVESTVLGVAGVPAAADGSTRMPPSIAAASGEGTLPFGKDGIGRRPS